MSVLWGCKVGHCIKPLLSDDARDPLNRPITILLSPLLFKAFFFWATPHWPMSKPFSPDGGVTIPVRCSCCGCGWLCFAFEQQTHPREEWQYLCVSCVFCGCGWLGCVCFAFEQQTFLIWSSSDDTCAFLVRVVVVRCEAWCLLLSTRRRHTCPQVWAPLWPALWPVTIFPDLSHLLCVVWFKCALRQASLDVTEPSSCSPVFKDHLCEQWQSL